MSDKLNAERYSDPTAYCAMKNIEREERRKRPMSFKRGEIYYVESGFSTTVSEQRPGRPAVIVSNDKNNAHSTTVEVVYLTTQPKADLPTHVLIRSLSRESTATAGRLCCTSSGATTSGLTPKARATSCCRAPSSRATGPTGTTRA